MYVYFNLLVPPSIPTDISFSDMTSSSFQLQWTLPGGSNTPLYYRVSILGQGSSIYQVIDVHNSTSFSVNFENLAPGQLHLVNIEAIGQYENSTTYSLYILTNTGK